MGKALIIKGADFSQVAVDTIDIIVAQPTISIDLFGNVTIASPNGEDIYYTTDGSTPTNQSTKYTASFSVQMNTTVKAVCYLGGNYSEVVSQLYNATLQAPVISITDKGVVTITATDNASIRYTVNGADPTSSTGTLYSDTFKVEDGDIVKAIAYLVNGSDTIESSVASVEAEVVESILAGKRFKSSPVNGTSFDASIIDDNTRFISPKIHVGSATTYAWARVGQVNGTDFLLLFDSNDIIVGWDNVNSAQGSVRGGASYMRFSGLLGTSEGSSLSFDGGAPAWTYNGETE